jgi:myo-inositol-1(or 4)-monophosphatase
VSRRPLDGWLERCRTATEAVREAVAALEGRAAREPIVGEGLGGDETTAVDAAAEAAAVGVLRASGEPFVLVSEELGEERVNGGGDLHVVLDPIDGSLNAKRGLPFFAVSIAVARGSSMGDVELGYVFDFGTGEEWTAERGRGAFLDGERLGAERPKDDIEILAFEATTTAYVAERAAAVAPLAYRLRIFGSLALSLCHLAAGRLDAVCSLKAARSVDIAAAQLLVREVGLAVDLFESGPFEDAPLDLNARSRVVAAATPALCAELAGALR